MAFRSGNASMMTSHLQAEVVDLYGVTYAQPPYCENDDDVADYAVRFGEEVRRPGFGIVTAVKGTELIGTAYGFTFESDKWWTAADQPPDEIAGKLKFAVVELFVHPDRQGLGVGRNLMTRLLRDREEPYATLCSVPAAAARSIYDKWGWREVGKNRFPGMPTMDVLVMPLPWR